MDRVEGTLYFRLNKFQLSILDNNKGFINLCFISETELDEDKVGPG